MGKHYRQIDLEERCRLRGIMEQGLSITKIARHLGRDRRTIQRELATHCYQIQPKPPGCPWSGKLRQVVGVCNGASGSLGFWLVSV